MNELADRIRQHSGPDSVVGATEQQIAELHERWAVDRLPATYVDFLRTMGFAAGTVLVGTNIFLPRILEMPSSIESFCAENAPRRPPDGALIFGMHQGYQVYWLDDRELDDSPVSLYMERRALLALRLKAKGGSSARGLIMIVFDNIMAPPGEWHIRLASSPHLAGSSR